MSKLSRLRDIAIMSILPILVLVTWEVVVRQRMVSTFLLPSVGQVIMRLWSDLQSGEIAHSTMGTVVRLATSYSIATVLGIVLGVSMSRVRSIRWLLDPLISIAYPTPKISFLPILVLWLGVFDKPKITISIFSCIFPIIAGTWAGTQSVDKYLVWSAQNL
jgi:ABC-type nitrate/sulfonate/bicarbonate transport system permease component